MLTTTATPIPRTGAGGAWKGTSTILAEVSGRAVTMHEGRLYSAALEADGLVIHTSVRAAIGLECERARAAVKEAIAACRAARRHVQEAVGIAETAGPPRSSLLALVLYGLGLLVIQVAEFVLTWTSLPMLIGVRRYSVEGVLVSALPVAALLALEFVFARAVAARSQLHASADASGGRRLVVALTGLAVGIGLLALLALNLGLVDHLALLRELGASVAMTEVLDVDNAALIRAIRVISIAAAIDGAILLVLLEAERLKRRAQRALRAASLRALEAERQLSRLLGELRHAKRIATEAEGIASQTRDAFLKEAALRVQQAIDRSAEPEPRSLEERVASLLRRPVASIGG